MQPTLNTVTLPYPTTWSITPIEGEVTSTTLSGKARTDVFYRKYKYVLNYDMLSKTDFETLQNAINNFIDNNLTPTFTYSKIGVAESGVEVIPRLSQATRVGGAGNEYRISIQLELIEVNSR